MSWDKITLGSIADIFSGYAFKSADMNAEYGTPLLKIKNISYMQKTTLVTVQQIQLLLKH